MSDGAALPEHARARLLAEAAAAFAAAPVASCDAPSLPARYELVRELGRGGMGVVYEAIDHQLGRRCALKTLPPGAALALRERLQREALAAARLRHPHIATVYDATADYISMQLLVGCTIDQVHASERRLLVELLRDAARAVHHAHEQGLVHRDLKPSNLVVEGRHVYVVDFGLAKQLALDASLPGGVVGTPAFMAPEQARGAAQLDGRADVYGLGATLYACLCGAPPFTASDLPALLQQVLEREPAPLRVERDLDVVVHKCLAKDPAQRYASAAALADDLDRWLQGVPVSARRPSLLYRLRKRLVRQRALWRAAASAAAAVALLMALLFVPRLWRESAARTAANEAVELADHAATVLRDAGAFHRLGDNASAQQALDAGLVRLREFLARHDVPRARYLLSRLLRARGQPSAALAELERALTVAPELLDARFERGLLLAAMPEPDARARATAIADLTVSVRDRTVLTAIDRLFGRGELLRLQGQHAAAHEVLREVLETDPAHVAARLAMAQVAIALGQDDLARYYSASAIDFQQGFGPYYVARERQALPTTIAGVDALLIDCAAALGEQPGSMLALAHRSVLQLRRAVRLEIEGDLGAALVAADAALADAAAVVQAHDDVPGARNNLAVCHLVSERLRRRAGDSAGAAADRQSAQRELETVRARDASRPELPFNLGLCALRTAELERQLGRDPRASAQRARESFAAALSLGGDGWGAAAIARSLLARATAHGD